MKDRGKTPIWIMEITEFFKILFLYILVKVYPMILQKMVSSGN